MNWEEMFSGKCFISDLGEEQLIRNGEDAEITLGRYAAWAPFPEGKNHQIVEVGNDLEELMKKYHIPQDRVCILA